MWAAYLVYTEEWREANAQLRGRRGVWLLGVQGYVPLKDGAGIGVCNKKLGYVTRKVPDEKKKKLEAWGSISGEAQEIFITWGNKIQYSVGKIKPQRILSGC